MRRLALPKDCDTDCAPTRNLQNGPKVLQREPAGSTGVFRAASVGAACLHRECQRVVGRELVAA
jgi:hypothetical protein